MNALLLMVLTAAVPCTIDSNVSQTSFAVSTMVVGTTRGHFGPVRGEGTCDFEHLEQSKISATIDVAGVSTGNEKRDAHLRTEDFFDVQKFPQMSFVSTRFEKNEVLVGQLTIHGKTREVRLQLKAQGPRHYVAKTKLDRRDFGITHDVQAAIGYEIDVTVDITFAAAAAP